MVKPKCVVALGLPSDMIDTLGDAYDVAAWPESQPMPEAVLKDWLTDANGLLCALSTPISAALLEHASRLQVISTISVGVDCSSGPVSIDVSSTSVLVPVSDDLSPHAVIDNKVKNENKIILQYLGC